ncbi:MAG: hypothetical protein ACLR93_05285 [Alistipes onderdonkii]
MFLHKFSSKISSREPRLFHRPPDEQHTPDNKPGVMERIAVISVALSVAVMILAMAVIMGF